MAFTPGLEQSLAVQLSTDGVDNFADDMDSAGNSMLSLRKAAGLAGGALAALSVGGLAAATSAAADFEEAMIEVEKVTDPTTAAAMSAEIRDLATNIPLAQKELAALAADAARFGVRGPENIRQFTEATAKMATATNLGTQEAGEALARLSELTDTPVDKIENLGSVVNELSNNFATSSSEIVDSMLRASGSLAQLGLNQRQIAGLTASLNEVSESSERAGTRLRRLGQELLEPGKVDDVSSALGLTAEEFEALRQNDPSEIIRRMAETMQEGGSSADKLRSTLSSTSRQAVAGLAANMEGLSDATTTANESYAAGTSLQGEFEAATSTFNSQLKLLKNRFRNSAIEIGNVFLPELTNAIKAVNTYLDSSDTLLSRLSAQEKAWGLVAGAISGVSLAIGLLVSGPFGLLVGALGALGSAYSENLYGFRDAVDSTFGFIGRTLDRVREETLGRFLDGFERVFDNRINDILGEFTETITSISETLTATLAPAFDAIPSAEESVPLNVFTEMGERAGEAANQVQTLLDTTANLLETDGSALDLSGLVPDDGGESLVSGLIDSATEAVNDGMETLTTALADAGEFAVGLARRVGDAMLSFLPPETRRRVEDLARSVLSFARSVSSFVFPLLRSMTGLFIGLGQTVAKVGGFFVTELAQPILAAVGSALVPILMELLDTSLHVATVIVDAFTGLVDGITAASDGIVGAVEGILNPILTVVSDAMDFLTEIVTGGIGALTDALETAIGVFGEVIEGALNLLQGDFEEAFESFASAAETALEGLKSFATGIIDDIKRAITGFGSAIGTALRTAINDALGLPWEHTIGEVNVGGETVFAGESVRIPALAEGGVVTGPTTALVGEAGPEAVVPLDKLDQMLNGGGSGGPETAVIQIPGDAVRDAFERGESTSVRVALNDESRQNDRLRGRPRNV